MTADGNGRIALVTGANRGLGFEICRQLGQLGFHVISTARTREKADTAAHALHAEGIAARAEALDVGRDDDVTALFARLDGEGLSLDVLVNNAGAIFDPSGAPTFAVPAAVLAQAFDVNALGAYRTIVAAMPGMLRRGRGRIVNVSSGMGALHDMGGRWPAYRVSKAALLAITRIFHAEARGDVLVNAVCPGWVRTDMGGAHASRSVEDGARGIVWAATLPPGGPSGGFFRDGQPLAW